MKYPDFWHKQMPCANQSIIQQELKVFLAPHIARTQHNGFEHVEDLHVFTQATPSLTAWMQELGCSAYRNVALVIIGANKNQNTHTDAQQNDLALNIGLQVYNTSTHMYKIVSGNPTLISYGTQGLVYTSYAACALEKYTQFELSDHPVLFNTKHVHHVMNPTGRTRIAVSLRFIEDPDHLFNH